MAKVLGVGGIFFKAKDPAKLGKWYQTWLGVDINPDWGGTAFMPSTMPEGGYTVFAPFKGDTTYFEPSKQAFMINLIVDNLDDALAQVQEGGAELVGDPQDDDYGKFGWFIDPDGNKIELWQPNKSLPQT